MNENSTARSIKNIRAMLKSPPHSDGQYNPSMDYSKKQLYKKPQSDTENEHSISFNVTPEEDEIAHDLVAIQNVEVKNTKEYSEVSKRASSHLQDLVASAFEKETQKVTSEAIELLESTKKIMEGFDTKRSNGYTASIKPKLTVSHESSMNSYNNSYLTTIPDEKPKDYSKIVKIGDINRDHNISCKIYRLTHLALSTLNNTENTNQKLLERVKNTKNLEKELRDKNAIIEKLTYRVNKQKETIDNLNEKLNVSVCLLYN
jgi:hypothetical protein